jgi:HAD superfamily hydrolase (TIGR01459 family)
MLATSVADLLERYDVFFLDAYGVLVSTAGALPGAADFVARIVERHKQYLVLTNDASRLPETLWERYRSFGLPVDLDRIVTSGSLLSAHFRDHGLGGAPTIVLGPPDSVRYVERAGGVPVATNDESAEVVALCDDDGYDVRLALDDVITVLFRRLDAGRSTHLVMPNPDLLYLRGERAYGITAGALALVIEAALELRYAGAGHRCIPLGKPHAPMYSDAMRRAGTPDARRVVMLGDQLATDIRGARAFGIDSVLLGTGIARVDGLGQGDHPTWTLEHLG